MNRANGKIEWFVWSALLLTILVIALAFVRSRIGATPQTQATGGPEQSRSLDLRPIAQLPDFTLTNQDGHAFSLADLRGEVWVADIIFTRCAGPCPIITQRMSDLQKVLPAKLVTLTTDPDFDRPEVLKRFAERFKANFAQWTFLTGSKEGIARVTVDGLKLAAVEKKTDQRENERDLFIHSTLFVLVDRQGRLRGSVESDDPEMKPKILDAVKKLMSEK